MSYAGLGQTSTAVALTQLPPGSALIVRLQSILMQQGVLHISTADGIISSDTSATLAAIRSWATSHSAPSTGISRTSGGGLSIPTVLLNAILATRFSAPATTTPAPDAKASAALPPPEMVIDSTPAAGSLPRWVPWAAGALTIAIFGGAFVLGRR